MKGSTLFIRHLPSSLTKEEKEDFLQHFGAVRVRVMGNKGPLKHTAFAEFPNADVATQVLNKLHQVEVLGCRLVVEVARSRDAHHYPTVDDSQPDTRKEQKSEKEEKEDQEKEDDLNTDIFDVSFHQWGLKYPRRRRLYYLYPPPSPSILANISNALAACPKFYVQVLHLMNKMDLPAPFGPVTAQPPVGPDASVGASYKDRLETEEMSVSSTEESELESDTEMKRSGEETIPKKRKATKDSKSQIRKRARLAMSMFQPFQQAPETHLQAPSQPLTEFFEQEGDGRAHRKIQLRLPSAMNERGMPPPVHPPVPPPPVMPSGIPQDVNPYDMFLPPLSVATEGTTKQTAADVAKEMAAAASTSTTDIPTPSDDVPQSSGFGIITPVSKPSEEKEEEEKEEGWAETKFISKSELRHGRLSRKEMDLMSIFRNYQEGEPSRRLYIKNLAKQVTEEDIHWIFGRYVNWDDETEKNIFDIRLMKEGRMKGQAFVTLGTDEKAVKAVRDTNAFVLKGKPIAVTFARSAKQQGDRKDGKS